jgi:thiol-disulfide isomerase/thioredoxin
MSVDSTAIQRYNLFQIEISKVGGATCPAVFFVMRKFFFLLIILFASSALSLAAEVDDLTVLYFFSSDCTPCKNIEPIVKDLSREFKTQGLVYGQGTVEAMPFEVLVGNEERSKRYGITDYPALAVLLKGNVKQVFRGESDMRDVKSFLYSFGQGALSVSEAVNQKRKKNITLAGWVIARGEYFKDAQFFITDRTTELRIKAWLPLEAAMSPFRKKRSRLMSDVINKPVLLRGTVVKKDHNLEFVVKEEVTPGKN